MASCPADIERIRRAGKTGVIPAVEEGGILGGRLERLDILFQKGVRIMTLLWNYENCLGFPNSRDRRVMERGLKPFGIRTVERMNELGMMVDVSMLPTACSGMCCGTAASRFWRPIPTAAPWQTIPGPDG